MRILLVGLALALAACRSVSAPPIQEISPPQPTTYTYREAGGQELNAYVFSPSANSSSDEPASAILLFHGGGWSAGTPEWTFKAARRFAGQGMVAISVQYRLSNGNVTPIEALADVCAAFRWAREHASDLGIGSERVAGYGVSAGGHLVTAAATVGCPQDGTSGVRSEPDALLLWSPALDMTRDGWFERKLQGRATAEAYSPVEHVRASTPPTSIVQGDADTLTPLSGARKYCARLIELDETCDLYVYEGVGHLLTRNVEYQEGDFDPDPEAVADGVEQHLRFLRELGF
ncbi:MAG: alpha/beta hydrolase [bacterium]|nr:alpha/beta hydrolase [bacterium]